MHVCKFAVHTGVCAVTQARCQPVFWSNARQWGLHFALCTAAVHCCRITAQLEEEQTHGQQNKPAVNLFCTTPLSSGACSWPRALLECTGIGPLHSRMKSKSQSVCSQHSMQLHVKRIHIALVAPSSALFVIAEHK
jgi:hypothetical protein